MAKDPYSDFLRSLQAYCNDFLTRKAITGFEVFDFEAHAVENELPNFDLIGINDYMVENQKDMYEVSCVLTICTKADDQNLNRLRGAISAMFAELKPGKTDIPIKSKTGLTLGNFVVHDPVTVIPVGKTKTRPIQGIAVSFGAGYLPSA